MSDKQSDFWSSAVSAYREGCEEARAEIRAEKEKAGTKDRIVDGMATGVATAAFNPISWLLSFLSS